jgi:hypothetical protein
LNQCSRCSRDIPETSTACTFCDGQAPGAGVTHEQALVPVRATAPDAEVLPVPANHAARHRELILVILAVVSGGLMVFLLLFARSGSSSSTVSAAPVDADAISRPRLLSPKESGFTAQHWTTDNRAHWLGGMRGAAFELLSENTVQTWFGTAQPALIVRCTSKTVQAFIYTGSAMKIEPNTEGKTVTVSIDGEAVKTERWPDADDHDALFAPDGPAFTDRLLRARTLRFGYSPHNAKDVVAHFNVAGLAELIEPAAKECGWKK